MIAPLIALALVALLLAWIVFRPRDGRFRSPNGWRIWVQARPTWRLDVGRRYFWLGLGWIHFERVVSG